MKESQIKFFLAEEINNKIIRQKYKESGSGQKRKTQTSSQIRLKSLRTDFYFS